MRMYRNLASAGLALGIALAGGISTANAHYRGPWYPGCHCGPIAPTTRYNTVRTSKSVTRYHDVNLFKHVERVHHVTNVTRIQPVIYVHDVTRVHHHTIVDTRTAYHSVTQHLTPISIFTHSTQNYYDCGCGW